MSDLNFHEAEMRHFLRIMDYGVENEGDEDYQDYSFLYRYIEGCIAKNYTVIYVVESNTTNKSILQMNKMGIETERTIESGRLTIVDRDSLHFPKVKSERPLNAEELHQSLQSLVTGIRSKSESNNVATKIMLINTIDTYLKKNDFDNLWEIEQILKIEAHETKILQVVCCCNRKSLTSLPLNHVISVLYQYDFAEVINEVRPTNNHNIKIKSNRVEEEEHTTRYIDCSRYGIISLISEALNTTLGNKSSDLVFKTLELVYRIDEDVIFSNPHAFSDALGRLLGNSMKIFLESIYDEFR